MPDATVLELDTPQGLARAHVQRADDPVAVLVLGHGAGGTIFAPDLKAVTAAAQNAGLARSRSSSSATAWQASKCGRGFVASLRLVLLMYDQDQGGHARSHHDLPLVVPVGLVVTRHSRNPKPSAEATPWPAPPALPAGKARS